MTQTTENAVPDSDLASEDGRPTELVEFDVTSEEFRQDCYATYRRLGDSGPIHLIRSEPDNWLLVTDFALGRAVLSDARFSKRQLPERYLRDSTGGAELPSMLGSDDPEHARLRDSVSDYFSPTAVEAIRPWVAETCTKLVDELLAELEEEGPGGGGVDLRDRLAVPLSFGTLSVLLGVPEGDRSDLHAWTLRMLSPSKTDEERAAAADAVQRIRGLVEGLVAQARSESITREHGLLQDLARGRGEPPLDDHEVTTMVTLVLAAGYQGAANLILNTVAALLSHEDQWRLLVSEPERVLGAVHETLRYNCPIQRATLRVAVDNADLCGVSFHAGDLVAVSLAAANHDATRYEDPDGFDITRPTEPHLAFGHGIHRCLGAGLAVVEATTALTELISRAPGLKLHSDQTVIDWAPSGLLRGPSELRVVAPGAGASA